jgi:two-component system KDP operon response regulator KdpE
VRHRRALEGSVNAEMIEIGDLRIDVAAHVALIGEQVLALTRKEFALLAILARNAGKVLTYRKLLVAGWGAPSADGSTQGLRTHMAVLRRKLAHGQRRPSIVNESGVGYRLVLPNDEV